MMRDTTIWAYEKEAVWIVAPTMRMMLATTTLLRRPMRSPTKNASIAPRAQPMSRFHQTMASVRIYTRMYLP